MHVYDYINKPEELLTPEVVQMLVAPARNDNDNKNGWSSVSVAGDSRITPFGATLRHWSFVPKDHYVDETRTKHFQKVE